MTTLVADAEASDPRCYVTADELKSLYVLCPWRIASDLALDWLWILAAIAAWGWSRHPLALGCAFVIVASRQHALNNWVHEAAHYSLTRNKALNDWLSDAFAATPHFISTADYRAKHIPHHSYLGDPHKDTELKSRFLITGSHLWKRVLITLLGGVAWQTLHTYTDRMPIDAPRGARARYGVLMVTSNSLLALWAWHWGAPLSWFYLWALPLVTLTPLLATLRVIAEHQSVEYAAAGHEQFDQPLAPAITRTIETSRLTAFLLAPVNFNFHFVHHAWPAIPYTSLPALSQLLSAGGYYQRNPQFYGRSYAAVLAQLMAPTVSSTA